MCENACVFSNSTRSRPSSSDDNTTEGQTLTDGETAIHTMYIPDRCEGQTPG